MLLLLVVVTIVISAVNTLAFFVNHKHYSCSLFLGSSPRKDTYMMHHPSSDTQKRIVLIGGGHAHVQVIKALNSHSRGKNIHVTLIDLQSEAAYSGMVPGCVAKLYKLDQVKIALDSLAEWSGIEFIRGKVVGMSLDENDGKKVVLVEETNDINGDVSKKEIQFDVVSVDIGSTTRNFKSIPGAKEFTVRLRLDLYLVSFTTLYFTTLLTCLPVDSQISTRPISDLVKRIEKEEDTLKEKLRYVKAYLFLISCYIFVVLCTYSQLTNKIDDKQ